MQPMLRSTLTCIAVGLFVIATPLAAQDGTILTTVLDESTGDVADDLAAQHFTARDGDTKLRVESVERPQGSIDIVLLLDTSMVGNDVRPIALALIDAMTEGDAVALFGFDEGAVVLQDFTSDKARLEDALDRVDYGNVPRVMDGLYATVDGGFEPGSNRRAIVLVSAGPVAGSRMAEAEVIAAARENRVSIYPVFARNNARTTLRRLALQTGGASFAVRRTKLEPRALARKVFEALRKPYLLSVSGVLTFGDRIEVEVAEPSAGKTKLTASALLLQ